jgi:hypothetical protein
MRIGRAILLSLPFWWFLVTAVQLLLLMFGSQTGAVEWLVKPVIRLVDLVVPYGIWNAAQVKSATVFWHVASFFAVLAVGEYIGRRLTLTPSRKILYNLGILFLWTATVEWAIWGIPCSVMTWIDGYGCRPRF